MAETRSKRIGCCIVAVAVTTLCGSAVNAGEIQEQLKRKLVQDPLTAGHRIIVRLRSEDRAGETFEAVSAGKGGSIAKKLRDRFTNVSAGVMQRIQQHHAEGKAADIVPLWIADAIALTAATETIYDLATRPDVAEVAEDAVIRQQVPVASAANILWDHIGRTGAPLLWQSGITGRGVVVATLDSGVDITHPTLLRNWRGGSNSWFDPYDHTSRPLDDDGHGTAVMSIIAGGAASGSFYGTPIAGRPIGVAPDAVWIAARIFHRVTKEGETETVAETSKIHAAYQWILDPDGNPATNDSPDIVNNSWDLEADDYPLWNQEFRKDIQKLKSAGIAVVFAAGNEGDDDNTSTSPANYPESFAVGGSGTTDRISQFSSRGPSVATSVIDTTFPHVTAPAENILVAVPTRQTLQYDVVDGTSFAAPHVTGAMALLLSAEPQLTPQELEDVLKSTAIPVGERCPNNRYGYGVIAVDEAARKLGIIDRVIATGDMDGDGVIDIRDVLRMLRAFVSPPVSVAESKQLRQRGDVAPQSGDQQLNVSDILTVLKNVLGLK